ncbi:hypothetical protein BDV06DRAFT_226026 [Aspergillus oleicola]
MRWTKEAEETLWQTIFNTQTINLELDKISEAWPENDKPTPKALKEHLQRYRKAGECKVTFSLGKKGAASGGNSAPATPRKRGTAAKKTNGTDGGTESAPVTPRKRGTPGRGKGKGAASAQALDEAAAQGQRQAEDQADAELAVKEAEDANMTLSEMDGNEADVEAEDALESPNKKAKMDVVEDVLEG